MICITWNDIELTAEKMFLQITESRINFDCIVGIGGSGLVHALLLAKKMDVPLIPIMVSSYDGRERKSVVMKTKLGIKDTALQGKNILIVDDIIASGDTLKTIREHLVDTYKPSITKSAVAYVSKKLCTQYPDFYGEEYVRNDNEWILFPWDDPQKFPEL